MERVVYRQLRNEIPVFREVARHNVTGHLQSAAESISKTFNIKLQNIHLDSIRKNSL